MGRLVSLIIPVFNEARVISSALQRLSEQFSMALAESKLEIIVVDGGSRDHTIKLARSFPVTLVSSVSGRAKQMNKGAEQARGDTLFFVHIDTALPDNALAELIGDWGFFTLALTGREWWCRVIAKAINWRTGFSYAATGDQCIFVKKAMFHAVGGYNDMPLMEDLALSNALKKQVKPTISSAVVTSSSRRWRAHGVLKTIVLMWALRVSYYCGVSPERLKRWYT